MANQEGYDCEVPHKRPRLDGGQSDLSSGQDDPLDVISHSHDSGIPSKGDSPAPNGDPLYLTSESTPDAAQSQSTTTKSTGDGSSSSGEAIQNPEDSSGARDSRSDSDVSDISDLSGLSEDAWKPIAGPMSWVQRQMIMGENPRDILQELVTADTVIPTDLDDFTMWKIIINLMSEPPKRKKLQHINTLDDVLGLLRTCKKIMVLTGAGVSVSCGIPDFRSRNGIYARLAVDFPDLPDPQAMFDIRYFRNDQRPFFKFAKEIYPGQFEPSRCHKFIQLIEQHGKLLRNYTQNIDTLEQVAGIKNIIQCHGSFASATCMVCRHKVTAEDVKEEIFSQIIPHCPVCPSDSSMSILKPDIVFFGESLPDEFHRQMAEDKDECDLLIVIGSSLKVRPVALIPNSLPSHVPQILINREPLSHVNFDVELLGDCDCIISDLCKRLGSGWLHLADDSPPLVQIRRTELATPQSLSSTDLKGSSEVRDKTAEFSTRAENMSPRAGTLSETKSPESQKNRVHPSKSESDKETVSTSVEAVPNAIQNTESTSLLKNVVAVLDSVKHCEESGKNSLDQKRRLSDTSKLETTRGSSTAPRTQTDLSQDIVKSNGLHEKCHVMNRVSHNNSEREKSSHVVTSPDLVTEGDNPSPDEDELLGALDSSLEEMRKLWHTHERESIAKRLKDDQFLFLPPCRYVFHGAEVPVIDEEESADSDQDSVVSESRDLHTSQCGDDGEEMEQSSMQQQHSDTKDVSSEDIKLFGEGGLTDVVHTTCT